jgi:dihydrodipicolinate synthase/N-acetylneuraminate lyase
MDTRLITPERLAQSVIAVPPLARDAQGRVDREQNTRLIRHIEGGGVNTLLYGGNANFYHIRPSEYAATLGMLAEAAAEETLIVPSAGPAYGLSLDQAAILRDFDFPTAMVLPHTGLNTPAGVETGVRRFAELYGKPVVLYIKAEGYIGVDGAARLVRDGLISWIKYAIVRANPAEDPLLSELIQQVGGKTIVSGIGEQPAIVHLRDFGCNGFTSGCVCIAPSLSQRMLLAVKAGDWAAADAIRKTFTGLEDLRNAINPVRVLHEAVSLGNIAEMGEIFPLLSGLSAEQRVEVRAAALKLREADVA